MASTDATASLPLSSSSKADSLLSLLWHLPIGGRWGAPHYYWVGRWGGKIQAPHSRLCWPGYKWDHNLFCGFGYRWEILVQKFSVFQDCLFLHCLAGESRLCCGFIFVYAYCCFQIARCFNSKSWKYEGADNPENILLCCALGPELSSLSAFFLPFRIFFYRSYMLCPGFLVVLTGRNRNIQLL